MRIIIITIAMTMLATIENIIILDSILIVFSIENKIILAIQIRLS